jgi:hypothetical protein
MFNEEVKKFASEYLEGNTIEKADLRISNDNEIVFYFVDGLILKISIDNNVLQASMIADYGHLKRKGE